ncbi:hypothetical protein FAF44_33510 [Nonomuraea sp. MG754425]|uniref:hypothetical protein n=1 Tax=Nonomuraea sp. MG754425 TaxID=2570319 RepID=UPI001F2112DC|nr:hypothetical protein [Nonomuraea sp. MG754425]MCF6473267.1 hypothetical protein [Nonomuraea sp. MG754425]
MGNSRNSRRRRTSPSSQAEPAPRPRRLRLDTGTRTFQIILVVLASVISSAFTFSFAPRLEDLAQRGAEQGKDQRLGTQPPLYVEVEQLSEDGGYTWAFEKPLTPGQLDNLNKPENRPDIDTVSQLLRYTGGKRLFAFCADECRWAGSYKVKMTGNRRLAVDITNIELRVRSRKPAPRGALLRADPQGGGALETIAFDLSEGETLPAVYYDENAKNRGRYFDKRVYSLEEGEPGGFQVMAYGPCWCLWELVVHSRSGGQAQPPMTIRADGTSNGKFFETVGGFDERNYSMVLSLDVESRKIDLTRPRTATK